MKTPIAPPNTLECPVFVCFTCDDFNFSTIFRSSTLKTGFGSIQKRKGNKSFQRECPISRIYCSSSIIRIRYRRFLNTPCTLQLIREFPISLYWLHQENGLTKSKPLLKASPALSIILLAPSIDRKSVV